MRSRLRLAVEGKKSSKKEREETFLVLVALLLLIFLEDSRNSVFILENFCRM